MRVPQMTCTLHSSESHLLPDVGHSSKQAPDWRRTGKNAVDHSADTEKAILAGFLEACPSRFGECSFSRMITLSVKVLSWSGHCCGEARALSTVSEFFHGIWLR